VCVCSLRYPACNAHAAFCHLFPAPALKYFSHYPINGTIFENKNVTERKTCVLNFSTTFVRNISHSKKKCARYDKTYTLVLMSSTRYSWPILAKLEFFQQIFEKSSNIKFNENPSSGSRVVPCGRTDMTKLVFAFRSFSKAPVNELSCNSTPIFVFIGITLHFYYEITFSSSSCVRQLQLCFVVGISQD